MRARSAERLSRDSRKFSLPAERVLDAADRDLPPEARDAMICSFECTFCKDCAEGALKGRCPNCGGELVRRPVRPADKLAKYPTSTERKVKAGGCIAA